MRIVALSDTHCCHNEIVVPDGDVFIHAGDFLSTGSEIEFLEFVRWIKTLPHEKKIIVAGNHDFFVADSPRYARDAISDAGGIYLQDESAAADELTFYGSPWIPEFMDWAFMLPRGAKIKEKWNLIPQSVDVLITHGPPYGIMDFDLGCEELTEVVFRKMPKVHIYGHIHECHGIEEIGGIRFVNASIMNERFVHAKRPVIIDL